MIVYVGAVAVLFLFVVMMLNIDFAELRAGFVRYLPLGALVAIILVAELIFALGAWSAGGVDLAARGGASGDRQEAISSKSASCSTRATSSCSRRRASFCSSR